jgi:hypothetical protein
MFDMSGSKVHCIQISDALKYRQHSRALQKVLPALSVQLSFAASRRGGTESRAPLGLGGADVIIFFGKKGLCVELPVAIFLYFLHINFGNSFRYF